MPEIEFAQVQRNKITGTLRDPEMHAVCRLIIVIA